jgi:hypothetical protein
VKPFARSGGENAGFALYSPSHPAQVGGEEPPHSQNYKNLIRGADLRGLLDGRVELYPVYRRLFYGVGPFRRSVRHALSLATRKPLREHSHSHAASVRDFLRACYVRMRHCG